MSETPAGEHSADYDRAAEACDGSRYCAADAHWHGCFLDLDGSKCDDPSDHHGYVTASDGSES